MVMWTCRSGMERSTGRIDFPGTTPSNGPFYRRPESEYDVDIYTIIFLALAVFIFLRLRSVLGQRTGNERPPFDRNALQGAQDKNVVTMPGKVIDQAPLAPTAEPAPPSDRWKGLTEPGTVLAQGLDSIVEKDSTFDPRHFISGGPRRL
ncbi:putative lipid-binding transport protein (Tim44 family) [Bradyrhizobium sp. F1.13.1]